MSRMPRISVPKWFRRQLRTGWATSVPFDLAFSKCGETGMVHLNHPAMRRIPKPPRNASRHPQSCMNAGVQSHSIKVNTSEPRRMPSIAELTVSEPANPRRSSAECSER